MLRQGFLQTLTCLLIGLAFPSILFAQEENFEAKINFQNESINPPSSFEKDFGQAYGLKSNGLTYGWLKLEDGAPLDLTQPSNGAGRYRNVSGVSLLQKTLIHMQGNDVSGWTGNRANEAFWEIAVPDGTYEVFVSVGDPIVETTPENLSVHHINIEGVNAINLFRVDNSLPAGDTGRFETATVIVEVNDGRLTIDANHPDAYNTKINGVTIAQTSALGTPQVTAINIPDGTTDVALHPTISSSNVYLPNAGIDANTLNNNTVKLYQVDGELLTDIPSVVSTSGGLDVVSLTPEQELLPNTHYRFEVTSELKDQQGVAFEPFVSTFTTGGGGSNYTGPISFVDPTTVASGGNGFTTILIGPDDKFYALTSDGIIKRWDIDHSTGLLSNGTLYTAIWDAEGGSKRLSIGMCFDPASTADNLILWVTHTSYGFADQPDFQGKVSRLSGENFATVEDYVIHLPRSKKDHATNGLSFGPDGALYVLQGANTAMGSYDNAWQRNDVLLSASLLRLDVEQIANENMSLPIDAQTENGGNYNPYNANAPLTLFATGIRNAYDMVWHSNGELYVPTNGSAGYANAPGSDPASTNYVAPQYQSYEGPEVPYTTLIPTQNDYVFRVEEGGYYGHPNPRRAQYVLNGGNPLNSLWPGAVVDRYPEGTEPDADYRGYAANLGLNKSPNGVIEYKSNAFNGALKGKMLNTYFTTGDVVVLDPEEGGSQDIAEVLIGIPGLTGYNHPLDVIEDTLTGNIYISEYQSLSRAGEGKITLLKPSQAPVESSNAAISIENMNKVPGTDIGFPADDWYTFHKNENNINTRGNPIKAHETNVMRIHNTGEGDLIIDSLVFTRPDRFTISALNGTAYNGNLPLIIAPNDQADLTIQFINSEGGKGVKTSSFTIYSNAVDHPQESVVLKGVYMVKVESSNEVNTLQLFDALGFKTSMNGQPRPSSDYPTESSVNNGTQGDLILSKTFVPADPSQPVKAFQLASFKGPGTANLKLIEETSTNVVGSFDFKYGTDYHQALFPKRTNTSVTIAGDEALLSAGTAPFRIWVDGYPSSGGNPGGNYLETLLGVRVYKVYDSDGQLRPNHYIVLQDYVQNGCGTGSANCDWNDNLYYFTNIKPATDPFIMSALESTTADLGVPFTYDASGAFDQGYPGNKLTFQAGLASGEPLPDWISLDSITGEISGTPTSDVANSLSIRVTATDLNGIVLSDDMTSFTLNVNKEDLGVPGINFWLEAECATATGVNWQQLEDETASGGGYIKILDGLNSYSKAPEGEDNLVSFFFNVAEERDYYFFSRVKVPNYGSDSFWFRVDDGDWRLWSVDPLASAFSWREMLQSPITLSEGPHTLQFSYRESGAMLDKIYISPSNIIPTGEGNRADNSCTEEEGATSFWLETECASSIGGNWRENTDATASAGSYMNILNGLNSYSVAPDGEDDILRYSFNVGQEGSYYFYARVIAPNHGSNSFWYRLDGGSWINWSINKLTYDFAWRSMQDSPFSLTTGVHTLEISYRESGAKLDKLYIGLGATTPSGIGETATNCDGAIANQAPLAHAGEDKTVYTDASGTAIVQLDGSASQDLDGSIVQYSWKLNDEEMASGVSPTISLASGTHSLLLTVTDDRGAESTDEVIITVSVLGSATSFWLETECASSIGGNWRENTDATASAGSYMNILNGLNSYSVAPDGEDDILRYSFNVGQEGSYYFYARVIAPNHGSDSFWYRLDGGSWINWSINKLTYDFAWRSMQDSPFSLTTGVHTLEISYRESGAKLDKLYIGLGASIPSGIGETATNCTDNARLSSQKATIQADEAVIMDETVGEEIKAKVYPNPGSGYFTVEFQQVRGVGSIDIINAQGISIKTLVFDGDLSSNLEFDITDQPSGLYLLQINTQEGSMTRRVIKNK